jgi:hypothetical protein
MLVIWEVFAVVHLEKKFSTPNYLVINKKKKSKMIEVKKKIFVGSFTKPQLRASHQKICFFF